MTEDKPSLKCPQCGDVFDTEHELKQHRIIEKNKNTGGNYYGWGKE